MDKINTTLIKKVTKEAGCVIGGFVFSYTVLRLVVELRRTAILREQWSDMKEAANEYIESNEAYQNAIDTILNSELTSNQKLTLIKELRKDEPSSYYRKVMSIIANFDESYSHKLFCIQLL